MVRYLLKGGKIIKLLPNIIKHKEKDYCPKCGKKYNFSKNRRACVGTCTQVLCLSCIFKMIKTDNYKTQLEKKIILGKQALNYTQNPSLALQVGTEQLTSIMETPPPSPDDGYQEQTFETKIDTKQDFIGLGYYFCLYCHSNGFKNKCCLGRHFRLEHSDIRPYFCKICDWTFDTQRNLGQHMLDHLNERTVTCYQCAAASRGIHYKEPTELPNKVQEEKHDPCRLYSCAICEAKFTEGSSFGEHLNNAHDIGIILASAKIYFVDEFCPECQSTFGYKNCDKVTYSECGHVSCMVCLMKTYDLGCGQCTTEQAQKYRTAEQDLEHD